MRIGCADGPSVISPAGWGICRPLRRICAGGKVPICPVLKADRIASEAARIVSKPERIASEAARITSEAERIASTGERMSPRAERIAS
jgi:hypothetical protein